MLALFKITMKKNNYHIIITVMLAIIVNLVFGIYTASADSDSVSVDAAVLMNSDEAALAELINAARRDPLGVAESLGMDRDEILNDLPELNEILLNGLPELAIDVSLDQSAGDHTQDMLENNYYAYESIDGKSPEQRMMEAGYVASASGEALGLIFFNNYISSEQAVSQIFENMYKDELSPEWTGPRNILNPDFEDLGVGFSGGLYHFNEISGNVYLSTCDYGASIETYEMQLMALINQLRDKPAAVSHAFGVTVAEILELFPEYEVLFANGLPPLVFSRQLYASAELQIADMIENSYWGHVSPEGVTPVMRIKAQGYVPIWAAESKSRLSTCENVISPAHTVPSIFKNMFFNCFKSQGFRDPNMLAEKAVECGFRIQAAQSESLSGICGDNLHITVGDFGASDDYNGPVLSGIVYTDVNANGLYDAGEGVSDASLTIKASGVDGAVKKVTTNAAGGYTAFMEPGQYRVSVGSDQDEQIQWVTVDGENVWQIFEVPDSSL